MNACVQVFQFFNVFFLFGKQKEKKAKQKLDLDYFIVWYYLGRAWNKIFQTWHFCFALCTIFQKKEKKMILKRRTNRKRTANTFFFSYFALKFFLYFYYIEISSDFVMITWTGCSELDVGECKCLSRESQQEHQQWTNGGYVCLMSHNIDIQHQHTHIHNRRVNFILKIKK